MLNTEQIQKVRVFLGNEGWRDVVRPMLIERGKNIVRMLMQPSAERPRDYQNVNEDMLRGQYREVEWMLSVWDNEIKVYEHNRALENGEVEQPQG